MRVALALAALAGATAFLGMFSQARGAGAERTKAARRAVVVELFTSEGCSSCPPAERVLRALAAPGAVDGAEVLALELHVDYWNDLGWTDPFSSAASSERQASYGASRVYTPQMIVAGGEEFVGSDAKRARAAIARAVAADAAPAVPLTLRLERSKDGASSSYVAIVDVGAHAAASELWLAVTEDGLATDVPRGENAGMHMAHAPVVRLLRAAATLPPSRTATATRTSLALAPGWKPAALRVVAFVQERGARGPGAISAAASARLP
jgi:hypothetical protein